VTVDMSARAVRLDLTDRPRPPEPPASDLVELPRKTLGRGLWGVGRRMTDLIQEKIQNQGGSNPQDGSAQPADNGADTTPDPADDNN
jgi:hypothetical protein